MSGPVMVALRSKGPVRSAGHLMPMLSLAFRRISTNCTSAMIIFFCPTVRRFSTFSPRALAIDSAFLSSSCDSTEPSRKTVCR